MKQRGFTLIEILIAMAIFTLIGLASTGLLTTVIDSNDLSSERFEKLQQLQRAMVIIERDIQQAVPRPVRAEGETQKVVMAGGEVDDSDGDGIGFVRGGWHNPQLMLPRSTLQYVAYRLDEDRLERVYSNYVDNVIGYEPKTRTLLENIESFTVEFISAESSSDDDDLSWSESYQGEVLPMAVAIEFVSKDFGLIRREFALTAGSA
ncbi:type II secretion system minor pseudopilin GspJ [Alteromonas stellipolaris]|jgi:general secretion pathway protein J|uniref:Type II secretion system protein J n=1 Tax=Alteromonas stellipolaris TaxID=233316 RepID=A0ABM5YNE3_9ALTE|nr:type II secretion system minor pseudopilin GspJ [Alteromonas stellipolaris]ALM92646.1 General secretion pathway protein J [Alteromonas stellipolaris LMG 21856]AMJ76105.1 type II secretion system protein GspJ [Alteromonas stellipolaris]AMJ96227.1 type II secretion system protein GspJ [Alteromonas stellipolaris]ANB20748.1 type II secretion system protein GspJ [Alteromonas stellipolaris]ANB25381.1 type II secretion system protein GspJ [Alteromonas stellipolaris]